MSPLNALIFGLGVFFLGLRLIGDNLRRLIGPGFRSIIKHSTHSPILGAGLGVGAGALMQSATAVTFILVSMTGSGLLKSAAAAPIIIWCNVGLTALAFVATLNIHPFVALVVGGAGIAMGTIRNTRWQALAGALLGMGLILIGLEQMSSGAAPLKDSPWFREAIHAAVSHPGLAFLAGVASAAILQSNTGAAMLVITLASGGLIALPDAMLLIYGSNLGAIGLRIFLSAGLRGEALRLVRLEDLFCVFGGLLMLALFALESLGIPLVAAFVTSLAAPMSIQLAVVLLLSNLLPALLLSPLLPACRHLLLRLWPDPTAADDPARPLFLTSQALADPPTALDLLSRELARLLASIRVEPGPGEPDDDLPPEDFRGLSEAIETFTTKLAARNTLSESLAHTLHLRRAELSQIRHVEETVRYYSRAAGRHTVPSQLTAALRNLLRQAAETAAAPTPESIQTLHKNTQLKGPSITALHDASRRAGPDLDTTASFEDFAMAVWTLHRLAKLLARLQD